MNSQAELSKPTRQDFKISKTKRTRSLSEYIPIYQSAYNMISACLIISGVIEGGKGGEPTPGKLNVKTAPALVDILIFSIR